MYKQIQRNTENTKIEVLQTLEYNSRKAEMTEAIWSLEDSW